MIIVAGWCRSGTSIMFKSIVESGFSPGDASILTPESFSFRILIHEILIDIGVPGVVFTKKRIGELPKWTSEPLVATDKKGSIKPALDRVINLKADVLKNPTVTFALPTMQTMDYFKDAKYIWMRRDPWDAAKSLVRLKCQKKRVRSMYRGVLTTNMAYQLYLKNDRELQRIMPTLNHIEVQHKDFVNRDKKTFAAVSEFIGTRLNTHLINKKKTYAGKRRMA